jgi:hypothetical protein
MNTKISFPMANDQDVTPFDLVQIGDHYKPTTAFIDEIAVDPPADEYDPAKLHVRTQEQTNHIHGVEKEGVAHWAE